MKFLRSYSLLTTLAVFALCSPVAQAKTWIVGTAPATKNANFAKIGDAVAAAANGDTIQVGVGLYDESVYVNKTLTLVGAPASTRRGNPATETVVRSTAGPYAVGLAANKISVSGFSFVGSTNVGMYTSELFSGYTITSNYFAQNFTSLYANSTATYPTTVRQNFFLGIDGFNGYGVFSDHGFMNASITSNSFSFNGAAIVLYPVVGSVQDVLISQNTSYGDGNFACVNHSRRVSITCNTATNGGWSQVYVGDGSSNVKVTNNTLTYGGRGIRISSSSGPLSQLYIGSNVITNQTESGIKIDPSSLTNSTIENNRCQYNAYAGIDILTGNVGNSILFNLFITNSVIDVRDASVGSGSGGTGNFWDDNWFVTANVSGLHN